MSSPTRFAGLLLLLPWTAAGYSVLTHEAIVDTLWNDAMRPAIVHKFPEATEEQLQKAHAYAYGGCIIQDLGYYPFGNHLFSDLVHYVRSADFVQALLDDAVTADEYAFALGALAHFGADIDGHAIAVNRAVPILFPKLRRKFGDDVTYGDNPAAHLKTEFGFDVLQVARGHYAPAQYHDFIGFEVSKELLDKAFHDTYSLHLKDIFGTLDLALGSYRFSVSRLLPSVTRAAWALKKDEIERTQPAVSRRQFLYNISRGGYRKEWGSTYRSPGLFERFLVFLTRILPKVGPLRGLAFRVPTAETEKMFEKSFDAAVTRDRAAFLNTETSALRIANMDLDTGKRVSPGEYQLADRTYDKLVLKLEGKKFTDVTPTLRANIVGFYSRMKGPDSHGIGPHLDRLKAAQAAGL
jgi:hypothetical protein